MKIVIDTNILISAGISKGITYQILRDILSFHTPILTSPIVQEYSQVVQRKKFIKYNLQMKVLMKYIIEESEVVSPSVTKFFLPDKDDEIFLQALEGGKGDLLITGNGKDFVAPLAKKFTILSPREYYDIYCQK